MGVWLTTGSSPNSVGTFTSSIFVGAWLTAVPSTNSVGACLTSGPTSNCMGAWLTADPTTNSVVALLTTSFSPAMWVHGLQMNPLIAVW